MEAVAIVGSLPKMEISVLGGQSWVSFLILLAS